MPKRLGKTNRYYQIYALVDPRDNAICYVGKTDDVQYRYYQHVHNMGGGKQERLWIKELKKLGLSPLLQILETISVSDDAHIVILQRERYWIDELVCAGAPLTNVFGIKRAYPRYKPSKQRARVSDNPSFENSSSTSFFSWQGPARPEPDLLSPSLLSTNVHDFRKLIENMPANLSELARLSAVSERSIMRMRDGESVLRGTANKVLRGLSQIYGQTFNLDNVVGINLYVK